MIPNLYSRQAGNLPKVLNFPVKGILGNPLEETLISMKDCHLALVGSGQIKLMVTFSATLPSVGYGLFFLLGTFLPSFLTIM